MARERDAIPDVPANLGPCVGLTLLGRGAMGAVYRARHTRLQRDVAVKIVNPRLGAKDPKLYQRFLREVELLRGLDDPHVVRILEAGQEGRLVYAVMELLLGRTLSELRKESPDGRMRPDAAAYYLVQVARGLDAIHRRGIVHRDVKPDNIVVLPTGTAKITDFGLARGRQSHQLTMLDEVVGTPEYMAPETIQHHEVDGRADLYSLGITAYELLTGATPFNQGGLLKVVQDQVSREAIPVEVKNPAVPPGLAAVVRKLLAKAPGDRYATGREVALALAPFACARPPHRIVVDAGPARAAATQAAPRPAAPPTAAAPPPPASPAAPRPGWGTTARPAAGAPAAAAPPPASGGVPTRTVARPTPIAPPAELALPGWEDLLTARLLGRHGVLLPDDLLDKLRAFQDPARSAGAPTFAVFLARTAGLPEHLARRAADAARRGYAALRTRIALSTLRRAGRLPPDALERAARESADRPLGQALVERRLLRPDEARALEGRVDEALGLARRNAIRAAQQEAEGAGVEAVRREALRRLLELL